ncbi:MAG: hypothetical protein GY867_07810 [bacterium]|nr:hypothetical protein [bacterium]
MRRLTIRTGLVLVSFILFLPPVLAGGEFSYTAGLGYEFLSQEFFLDSLAETGVDSLATITSLKTTFLDDIKGQVSFTYRSADRRRLELSSTLEQTPEIFRLRLGTSFRPQWGKLIIDWNGELDWRATIEDSAGAGDSYVLGFGKLKLMLPISGSSTLWGQVRSEFVKFDSAGDYSFDHNRLGGKLGLTWSMADLSALTANSFLTVRDVPDSSELDYLIYGAEMSYFGFKSRSTLDLFGRVEKKDYRLPSGQDDFTRVEVTGRHKLSFSDRWFSRQELNLEILYFDQADIVNRNYSRVKAVLQMGLQGTELSVALGPHVEFLSEAQREEISGQDYFEAGIRGNLDFFRPSLFGLIESTVGQRNMYSEAELLSDFIFHRLNLAFDWTIWGRVSLNAMTSAEWEWHENKKENSQLYLVSTWLTCRF